MRKVLLFFSIYFLTNMIMAMMHRIAYNEGVYDTWWIGAIYIVVCWIFAEIVSEKITRN